MTFPRYSQTSRRHLREAHSRQGFTLVEMLACVAVTGILLVLLFPSMKSALESSRMAACANQLRQIGMQIRGYATDHDGYLPANASSATTTAWWHVLYKDEEFRDFNKQMVCPSDPHPYIFKYKYKGETLKASYRYNVQMGLRNSLGNWTTEKRKLNLAINSAIVPLVAEWWDPEEQDGNSDSRTFSADGRIVGSHQSETSSNVLYLDGHIGRITERPVTTPNVWSWAPAY